MLEWDFCGKFISWENLWFIQSSKGVGEFFLFLGLSVFFVLWEVVKVVWRMNGFGDFLLLNVLLIVEKLRLVVGDWLVEKVKVVVGEGQLEFFICIEDQR